MVDIQNAITKYQGDFLVDVVPAAEIKFAGNE